MMRRRLNDRENALLALGVVLSSGIGFGDVIPVASNDHGIAQRDVTARSQACAEFAGLDFDQNCHVDLRDYRQFQLCATGPDQGPAAAGCETTDRDGDGDVDATDGARFPFCGSGPDAVADSACEHPNYTLPTGLDKIDEELAAGNITELDALRYKVFTVAGDDRLPSQYDGATFEEGTFVLRSLALQYGDLPPEAQDELRPFLLPPDAPGSWYAMGTLAAAGDEPPAGPFNELDVTDGNGVSVAVVKWPTGSSLESSAQTVRDALGGPDGVYTKLIALMGRSPISDAGLDPDYNGGDGRFDVYLVPEGSDCFGWTQPHSWALFPGIFGDSTFPSFIVMDVQTIGAHYTGADYHKKLRANISHEFMHAIQFAFDLRGYSRSDYRWLSDATATWAEHYVFPADNMEHPDAPDFLSTLDEPLEVDERNRRYGGYLYFFHHAHKHGDTVVRTTYESAEVADMLEAIDGAVPGGIAANWAEFAVANWNDSRDPPVDGYEGEDGLKKGASSYTIFEFPTLSGQQDELEMVLTGNGLEPLSAQYFHFILSEPDARTIMFANGLTFDLARGVPAMLQGSFGDETLFATYLSDAQKEHVRVLALVKQSGSWNPDPIDLSNVAFATFCNEAASEDLDEIVIIMANGRWESGERDAYEQPGLPSRLFVSNMGCGGWSGTASNATVINDIDESTESSANFQPISFTRNTLSLAQIAAGAGQQMFGPPAAGTLVLPAGVMLGFPAPWSSYELGNVSAPWSHDSIYSVGDRDCSEFGSGTIHASDAQAMQFSLAPYLTGTLSNSIASLYRSYFINTAFLVQNEINGTCVDSQGQVTNYQVGFSAAIGGGFRNGEFGSFIVDPSGDRIRIQNLQVEDTTINMDLTSQTIP